MKKISLVTLSGRIRADGLTPWTLLAALRRMRDEGIPRTHLGLCNNAQCHFTSWYLAEFWPKFSGDREYPVPHPNMKAEDAFHFANDLWGDRAFLHLRDPDDQYRRNRWDYLDWMIEQLESSFGLQPKKKKERTNDQASN